MFCPLKLTAIVQRDVPPLVSRREELPCCQDPCFPCKQVRLSVGGKDNCWGWTLCSHVDPRVSFDISAGMKFMGSSRLHPSVRKFLNRRVTLASSKSRTPDSNVMSLIWTRAFPRKYSLADTLSMLWCVDQVGCLDLLQASVAATLLYISPAMRLRAMTLHAT